MTDPGVNTAIQVATSAVADTIFKRASRWIRGRRLLLLGPARAGKSTLEYYIETKKIPGANDSSSKTLRNRKAGAKAIAVGERSMLYIRSTTDTPGATGRIHAEVFNRVKPHAVVCMTSAEEPEESAKWLLDFFLCSEEQHLGKLKAMVIAVNKTDLVTPEQASEQEKRINRVLQMVEAKVPHTLDPWVVQTIMIENEKRDQYAQKIVSHLHRCFRQ